VKKLRQMVSGATSWRHLGLVGGTAVLLVWLGIGAVVWASGTLHSTASVASKAKLAIRVTPAAASLKAGESKTFKVTAPGSKPTTFKIAGGLPVGASAKFKTKVLKGKRSTTLSLVTTSTSPAGSYTVKITAKQGALSGKATLRLTLSGQSQSSPPPPPAPVPPSGSGPSGPEQPPSAKVFGVSGTPQGELTPQHPQPVNLSLQNLTGEEIVVTSVTTSLAGLTAPEATTTTPCTTADFSVQQLAGGLNLTLPAGATRSLSDLGIPSSQWPTVALQERPVNQDGCQAANVSLSFEGTATGGKK
jgi:hypothetical protein